MEQTRRADSVCSSLLFVLALIGVCACIGALGGAHALRAREAKGAAQGWQAAAAWAQTGTLWHGGHTGLMCSGSALALDNDFGLCGGTLAIGIPPVPVSGNVPRWRTAMGSLVTFGGSQASPDSGGSLFFGTDSLSYRVIVRPESGLTARSLTGRAP